MLGDPLPWVIELPHLLCLSESLAPSHREVLCIHPGTQVSVRQPWAASPGPEASCPEAHLDRTANTSRAGDLVLFFSHPWCSGCLWTPSLWTKLCQGGPITRSSGLVVVTSRVGDDPHRLSGGSEPPWVGKPVCVDGVTSSSLWSSFVSPFFTFSLTF